MLEIWKVEGGKEPGPGAAGVPGARWSEGKGRGGPAGPRGLPDWIPRARDSGQDFKQDILRLPGRERAGEGLGLSLKPHHRTRPGWRRRRWSTQFCPCKAAVGLLFRRARRSARLPEMKSCSSGPSGLSAAKRRPACLPSTSGHGCPAGVVGEASQREGHTQRGGPENLTGFLRGPVSEVCSPSQDCCTRRTFSPGSASPPAIPSLPLNHRGSIHRLASEIIRMSNRLLPLSRNLTSRTPSMLNADLSSS